MPPFTPDGHKKINYRGLVVEADQFQLSDGTVLEMVPGGDSMSTVINITIDRVIIAKAIFKAEDDDHDEDDTEIPADEDDTP